MIRNYTETAGRKLWLDALRGIAMLLVIYGHSVKGWTEYFVFTSPVKMPLFFAISGYLFKPRGGNQNKFYKGIFFKLIIPWLVLGMIPNPTFDQFLNLLSGKKMWFMPCFIISEIIWFYIHKYANSYSYIVFYGVIASAFGFVMSYLGLLRYAMIDTAFVVQIFFVLGHTIRKYEAVLDVRCKRKITFSLFVYFALAIIVIWLYPGELLDVHYNRYFNIPICAVMITIGCVSLFSWFKNANICPWWLTYIGQNTLIIYLMHGIFLSIFIKGAEVIKLDYVIPLPLFGFVQTLFACVMCCILALLTNRYIPELVGKKRIKSN